MYFSFAAVKRKGRARDTILSFVLRWKGDLHNKMYEVGVSSLLHEYLRVDT